MTFDKSRFRYDKSYLALAWMNTTTSKLHTFSICPLIASWNNRGSNNWPVTYQGETSFQMRCCKLFPNGSLGVERPLTMLRIKLRASVTTSDMFFVIGYKERSSSTPTSNVRHNLMLLAAAIPDNKRKLVCQAIFKIEVHSSVLVIFLR